VESIRDDESARQIPTVKAENQQGDILLSITVKRDNILFTDIKIY